MENKRKKVIKVEKVNLKTKLKSILLILILLIMMSMSGCKSKVSTVDFNKYSTISSIVNGELKDEHSLDEKLFEITSNNGVSELSFEDLETRFEKAYSKQNYAAAESYVKDILKMIISAKVSELTGKDVQYVYDNIELPGSFLSFTSLEGAPYFKLDDKKYYLNNNDEDQFYRLVVNYINSYLVSEFGYDRPNTAMDRYKAAKESILATEKLSKTLTGKTVIKSDFSDSKIKILAKK